MTYSRFEPSRTILVFTAVLCLVLGVCPLFAASSGQGQLTIIEPDGKASVGCPLEHTSVKAEISGFVTRVEVKQLFDNPRQEKIEAIYTFPLSSSAAVDAMTMKVGERTVRGIIKTRDEAKRIYEQARDKGHVASLLDQERPNIFTQSVANIMPGEKVEITIEYVEILNYEEGSFKFIFPMVVGPRFIPGEPAEKQGTGWAQDTSQVPDASRITPPPVAEEGDRAGHDIDLSVSIDAGVPVEKIESILHEVDVDRRTENKIVVSLKNKKEIPNKDFVLKYLVAADAIRSGVIAHKGGEKGFATLVMIPPRRVQTQQVAPRELIFIVDTSGSQQGLPLQKAKDTMKYVIDRMNPDDTFNVIDFNDTVRVLFSAPKKNTPETRDKALRYIEMLKGSGGTRMIPAIWEALNTSPAANRLRIVTFMTDGFVGNDFEVISMVKKLRDKSRWFSFGTGNSVNRFLLENVARVGGGEVDYILLNSSGEEVAKKFYERIAIPVLTDISLSFDGIVLEEVYPATISDLWSHKPLVFKAKYSRPGKGTIKVKGFQAGKVYEQTLNVTLPEKEPQNSSLSSLWARAKVDELMDRDLVGIQRGKPDEKLKEEIITVALENKIMTQFTSFVAVEEAVVTVDGKPVTVTVPVELPEGVSREAVFGKNNKLMFRESYTAGGPAAMAPSQTVSGSSGTHYGSVTGGSSPGALSRKTKVSSIADEASPEVSEPSKLAKELEDLIALKEKPLNYSKGNVVVKDGKLTVQVWLNKSVDAIVKLLEKKGLRITFTASTGKTIIGLIGIEQLADLAKLPEVSFIEPFVVDR